MASRSISAILWTLVSVNVITLVIGGLITWLGYAIPVRLKQFGLLPELVIIAGFASLIVACIGLCALNYSSHLVLNIYGFSCFIFVLMLVLGIPEGWYKSDHFGNGSLLMDILYFSLLFILLLLLVFAFVFAQYLRRKDMLLAQNCLDQLDSDCNSPTACTCALACEQDNINVTTTTTNNRVPFREKWLSWTNRGSNNLDVVDASNLPLHSAHFQHPHHNHHHHYQHQQHQGDTCHLSDFRAPLYATNKPQAAGIAHPSCCTGSATATSILKGRATIQNQYAPLIRKGLYQTDKASTNNTNNNSLIRAKSCSSRPLNDDDSNKMDTSNGLSNQSGQKTYETQIGGSPDWRGQINRSTSNQWLATATRDDSSVQYGRQQQQQQRPLLNTSGINWQYSSQYQWAPITGRCRCNLASSVASLAATQHRGPNTSPLVHRSLANARKYQYTSSPYNIPPRLNSASTYAIRNSIKPKIRAKGSSSVVAMTAAVAAALLGGVADTGGSLAGPEEGIDDGLFAGANETELIMDDNQCDFDNNDHQLDVSMLNAPQSNTTTFYQNVSRQPVLDFTPLLDLKNRDDY